MAITKPVGDLPLEHIPIRLWIAGQMLPACFAELVEETEVLDPNSEAPAAMALQYADALLAAHTQSERDAV